jgi:hypothetical protein
MIPPIIIVGRNGDVDAFASVADAEGWMEAWIVEEGEYAAAFDAAGTRLAIEVIKPPRRGSRGLVLGITMTTLTSVGLRTASEPGAGADELRSLLASKLDAAPSVLELAALVQRVFAADERKRNRAERKARKVALPLLIVLFIALVAFQARWCARRSK